MIGRSSLLALAAAATLTACGDPEPIAVELAVDMTVGTEKAACGVDYALGTGQTTAQLGDGRLFLSAIQARNADGEWVDLELVQDGKWQFEDLVLLDAEDGTAACSDTGNADLNDRIQGSLPAGAYDALRFDVGVPFVHNHLDSATAPAPLNAQGMFWTWQGGYKFVRVDAVVPGEVQSRWNVHVGSTACMSDGPTTAPAEVCGRPNRASIVLEGFDPEVDTLGVDFGALFSAVDVTVDTPETSPGCMSMPMEPDDCAPVFEQLGLSFADGTCIGECADQTVFSAK